jgi:site-specific recombinase XerD
MAKATVVLYTSKKYKDGSSPIMLRITKNTKLKYFKIGDEKFNVKLDKWNSELGLVKTDKRVNLEHKVINSYINEKLNQAQKIVKKFEESGIAWTFNMFEEEYRNKPKITKVKPFIDARIIELQNQGKYNSSTGLKETLIILEKYYPNLSKLYFQDIDYKFIEGFYTYLKNVRGNRDTTIGIMLRGVRTVLNEAINRGVGSKESYPFSKIYGATQIFKISKLEKRTTKRFIPKEYMIKLVEAEILEPHLNWARQIFLFSFFASGINFKDMAFLKEDNIKTRYLEEGKEQKYIELNRLKTNESLSIPITENLKPILIWAKAKTTNDNEYLLPIITNKKLEGDKLNDHITQRRKRLNIHLRKIAGNLEFPDGLLAVSSYYARHSYATTMLRNGAQIEKISEALGHTNIKTTQIYLESFGMEEIAKFNEDLLK